MASEHVVTLRQRLYVNKGRQQDDNDDVNNFWLLLAYQINNLFVKQESFPSGKNITDKKKGCTFFRVGQFMYNF